MLVADLEPGSQDLGLSTKEYLLSIFGFSSLGVRTASTLTAAAFFSLRTCVGATVLSSKYNLESKSGVESKDGISNEGKLGKLLGPPPRWCWPGMALGVMISGEECDRPKEEVSKPTAGAIVSTVPFISWPRC